MNSYTRMLAGRLHTVIHEKLETRMIFCVIAFFFYSIVVAYIGKDAKPELLQRVNAIQHYDGMLLRTEKGYDFYDFALMNMSEKVTDLSNEHTKTNREDFSFVPMGNNIFFADSPIQKTSSGSFDLSIIGPSTLLANNGSMAEIFDADDERTYDLLSQKNMESVVLTSRKDILFTTREANGSFTVHYLFANCQEPSVLRLGSTDTPAADMLREKGLPIQKTITLSPSQTNAAVLDHAYGSHINILNLISKETKEVILPDFSDKQIHFAPTFLGDNDIAFSVIDGRRNATVLYSITDGTSKVISDFFSDAIYLSLTGKLVLLQSFYSLSGNVPFGSMKILQEQARIPRNDIEAILGDDNVLWRRVFSNPNDQFVSFHTDANERFKVIEDTNKRRDISQYWSSIFDPFVPKELEQKIVVIDGDSTTSESSMIYQIDASAPSVSWKHDISPLLETLELPSSVIEQYRFKRAQNGNNYFLESIH